MLPVKPGPKALEKAKAMVQERHAGRTEPMALVKAQATPWARAQATPWARARAIPWVRAEATRWVMAQVRHEPQAQLQPPSSELATCRALAQAKAEVRTEPMIHPAWQVKEQHRVGPKSLQMALGKVQARPQAYARLTAHRQTKPRV
jgi:hypothetical protein